MQAQAIFMKSLLIISYHAPPLNVSASERSNAFFSYLHEQGIKPTLVTHYWQQGTHHQVSTQELPHGTIIRVPMVYGPKAPRYSAAKPTAGSKALTLWRMARGHFEQHVLDSYYSLQHFLQQHLQQQQYHGMLAIYSPHNHLRLAYELHQQFGIPYAIDLRDLWDIRVMSPNFKPTLKDRLQLFFIERYWKKWLSKARFFTATSQPWMQKTKTLTHTPGHVLTNGYNHADYGGPQPTGSTNKFEMLFAGTLYKNQPAEVFLKGFALFEAQHPNHQCHITFLGTKKDRETHGVDGQHKDPTPLIAKHMALQSFSVLPRVPRPAAIKAMRSAHLLLFFGFTTIAGTYSGKIFEYLGAQRPILMAPGDKDVVEDLLAQTQAGTVAHTPEQVAQTLKKAYAAWQQNGTMPPWQGKNTHLYSRQNLVHQWAQWAHKELW